MTGLPIKPALCAGFLLMHSLDVSAQEYVDVEAERRAAAQAVTADVAEGAAVESVSSSYGGIQPYSGSTTVAQPLLEVDNNPITGTDSGSLILRVQQLEADVRTLTGLLEEATQALRALEAQSLDRYVDLDRRLSVGARPQEANVAAVGPGPSIPAAGESAVNLQIERAGEAEEGEEAAYLAAYELVPEKEWDTAVSAFIAFLSDYPFGRYAPNAYYWLGELYLVTDPPDPELARQNFKLLLDQYPANQKVPDALYKLGVVQFIKGNRQRSRGYLDEVIREYPSHTAAQLARQFLLENF